MLEKSGEEKSNICGWNTHFFTVLEADGPEHRYFDEVSKVRFAIFCGSPSLPYWHNLAPGYFQRAAARGKLL
jgi:hypothetical protein